MNNTGGSVSKFIDLQQKLESLKATPAVRMYMRAEELLGRRPCAAAHGCYGCGHDETRRAEDIEVTQRVFGENKVTGQEVISMMLQLRMPGADSLFAEEDGTLMFLLQEGKCVMAYNLFDAAGQVLANRK